MINCDSARSRSGTWFSLERECQRNIELVWLTGQLAPDFKTIADFRKDNGKAIREVCRTFVALCRELDLLNVASVAIDGSKFKAVNARDKNFTEAKMKRRLERIDPLDRAAQPFWGCPGRATLRDQQAPRRPRGPADAARLQSAMRERHRQVVSRVADQIPRNRRFP